MGIGVSLAVLTIPLLLEYLDWQTIWAILGCLCLVIAGMIKQYLNIEPVLVTQLDFLPRQLRKTPHSGRLFKFTLTHPPIICLAIIFACYSSQWITVTGFLPTLYVEQGLDLKRAGMLVSMVVLANLGGTFGAGMLLQQGYRPHTLLSTGFVGNASAAVAWYLLQIPGSRFELQVVSAVLFSLIGGMIPTTVFAITLHYAPRAYAAAASVGLVLQISACAQFFIPTLSAALISATRILGQYLPLSLSAFRCWAW